MPEETFLNSKILLLSDHLPSDPNNTISKNVGVLRMKEMLVPIHEKGAILPNCKHLGFARKKKNYKQQFFKLGIP